MGDGNSYAGSTVSHSYTTLGSFTATLTVTDDDGASSSTSISIEVYAQFAGLYWGDVCSNLTQECFYGYGIIGSDNRVFLRGWDYSTDAYRLLGGNISIDEDVFTGNLLAEIRDPYVFLDGTQLGNVSVEGTVLPQTAITVSYSGTGDEGGAYLNYNTPIDFPASLEKISGTWSWSDGAGYTETMVVDPDGSFMQTDTDGCVLVGKFTLMDLKRNEYDIEYDLTCPPGVNPAGDGKRKGLAFIDDWYETDIVLYWYIVFQEGPKAGKNGGSWLERPRPLASNVTETFKTGPQAPMQSIQAHPRKARLRPIR
jgi:hypothetical protein